jgi:hypothetical protein
MDRLLLTLGTLALALVAYTGMLKGWRARQRRQSDLPSPPTATHEATVIVGPVPGLFVGTTGADSWLDRIVVHHLSDRAAAEASVAQDGVHVARAGLPELFVPWSDLDRADVETAVGGKVVSTGMLVLTWRLGDRVLRSAFRADDRDAHSLLLNAITTTVETT